MGLVLAEAAHSFGPSFHPTTVAASLDGSTWEQSLDVEPNLPFFWNEAVPDLGADMDLRLFQAPPTSGRGCWYHGVGSGE